MGARVLVLGSCVRELNRLAAMALSKVGCSPGPMTDESDRLTVGVYLLVV